MARPKERKKVLTPSDVKYIYKRFLELRGHNLDKNDVASIKIKPEEMVMTIAEAESILADIPPCLPWKDVLIKRDQADASPSRKVVDVRLLIVFLS